jgi:hypothetical protein
VLFLIPIVLLLYLFKFQFSLKKIYLLVNLATQSEIGTNGISTGTTGTKSIVHPAVVEPRFSSSKGTRYQNALKKTLKELLIISMEDELIFRVGSGTFWKSSRIRTRNSWENRIRNSFGSPTLEAATFLGYTGTSHLIVFWNLYVSTMSSNTGTALNRFCKVKTMWSTIPVPVF